MKDDMTPVFLNSLTPKSIVFKEIQRVVWPPSWLGHTPFALWLMQELRPMTVVELGTHTGNSFSSFCQGARAIGYAPACYAIDTWQGDPHAGEYGEEVYEELAEYTSQTYGDFARLVRSTFNDALINFTDGTVDLLNIDGYHTYEATKENFETWLPKVSKRGVVLIHDINVRENDFGAWKFWEEISTRYPSFPFLHSHGLGVLCVGEEIPPSLQLLTQPDKSLQFTAEVRNLFSMLGAAPILRATEAQHSRLLAGMRRDKIDLQAKIESQAVDLHAKIESQATALLEVEKNKANLEQLRALRANLHQQSAKICELIIRAEKNGIALAEAELDEQRLQNQIDSLSAQLAEALQWKGFVQSKIGISLAVAEQALRAQAEALEHLNHPGHRFVSKVSYQLGRSYVGRLLRRLMRATQVLANA